MLVQGVIDMSMSFDFGMQCCRYVVVVGCSCAGMQLCRHVVCCICFVTSCGARVFFFLNGIAILVVLLNYHESSVCRDLGMVRRLKKTIAG